MRLAQFEVGAQLRVQARGEQGGDGDHGAVAGAELLLARPDLAEEHVVVEGGELRGDGAQAVSPRGLLVSYGVPPVKTDRWSFGALSLLSGI